MCADTKDRVGSGLYWHAGLDASVGAHARVRPVRRRSGLRSGWLVALGALVAVGWCASAKAEEASAPSPASPFERVAAIERRQDSTLRRTYVLPYFAGLGGGIQVYRRPLTDTTSGEYLKMTVGEAWITQSFSGKVGFGAVYFDFQFELPITENHKVGLGLAPVGVFLYADELGGEDGQELGLGRGKLYYRFELPVVAAEAGVMSPLIHLADVGSGLELFGAVPPITLYVGAGY